MLAVALQLCYQNSSSTILRSTLPFLSLHQIWPAKLPAYYFHASPHHFPVHPSSLPYKNGPTQRLSACFPLPPDWNFAGITWFALLICVPIPTLKLWYLCSARPIPPTLRRQFQARRSPGPCRAALRIPVVLQPSCATPSVNCGPPGSTLQSTICTHTAQSCAPC
jgi:hypothetical protein